MIAATAQLAAPLSGSKQDVRAVEARDDHALVVARVTKKGAVCAVAVRDSGDVLVHTAGPDLQLGPTDPVRIVHIQVWARPGPPPNTESRSSAAVRVFGEINGFCGTPSCEV